MKKVDIFTDGACRGNPGPGGYGSIIKTQGREEERRTEREGRKERKPGVIKPNTFSTRPGEEMKGTQE